MKCKLYGAVLCLFVYSSLDAMDHVWPEEKAAHSSEMGQALFPLKGIDAESFDDIFTYAYEGKIDIIKTFCASYDKYKNHKNENGETCIDFAAYGYINGEDSWKTFAYLLDANLPLSDKFKRWLILSEIEDALKDYRKKQIFKVIEEKDSFVETLEEPFYTTPLTPPDILIVPEQPSFISSIPRIIGLGAVAFIGAYVYQTRQLKKSALIQSTEKSQPKQKNSTT